MFTALFIVLLLVAFVLIGKCVLAITLNTIKSLFFSNKMKKEMVQTAQPESTVTLRTTNVPHITLSPIK